MALPRLAAPSADPGLEYDGYDAVSLLAVTQGSTKFAASTNFKWLAFASLEVGSCSCSHGNVEVNDCANGVCRGKIGGGSAGTTCECSVSMWAAMECVDTDDEQLFYGDLSWQPGSSTFSSASSAAILDSRATWREARVKWHRIPCVERMIPLSSLPGTYRRSFSTRSFLFVLLSWSTPGNRNVAICLYTSICRLISNPAKPPLKTKKYCPPLP